MKGVTWTDENKIQALLRLPWRFRVERNEDEGYFVARVDEIPSAIATGKTAAELEPALWESLSESLEVLLEFGDPIPLPPTVARYPWEPPKGRRRALGQIEVTTFANYLASLKEKQLKTVGV